MTIHSQKEHPSNAAVAVRHRGWWFYIADNVVGFHGWDLHAVWDDTKFATKHCGDVEKVAIIGDKAWEKWMAAICKPFTKARIRYLDATDQQEAWKWIEKTTV